MKLMCPYCKTDEIEIITTDMETNFLKKKGFFEGMFVCDICRKEFDLSFDFNIEIFNCKIKEIED